MLANSTCHRSAHGESQIGGLALCLPEGGPIMGHRSRCLFLRCLSIAFLIRPPGHQSSTRPLPRKACPLSPPAFWGGGKWDSKRPARKRDGYMCNRYGKTCGINYVVTPGPLYSCLLVNRGRLALLNVCCVELGICLVSLRTGDE